MNYLHYFKVVMCVKCGTPKCRNFFAAAPVLLPSDQLQFTINLNSCYWSCSKTNSKKRNYKPWLFPKKKTICENLSFLRRRNPSPRNCVNGFYPHLFYNA